MLRRLIIVAVVVLFALGEAAPSVVMAQDQTGQQQPVVKKRKTLLDLLFGGGQPEAPALDVPVVKAPKKAILAPAKPVVEKAPSATRLAVFGDSLAVDLAKALERLYAEDPNIVIINQGVGSSGFVRPDFFDWNTTIADQVAGNSFDLAVVIVGINDRQTLNLDGQSYKALTPEWTATYSARITDFVRQVRNANKPIIWVGLPPMAKSEYSAAINQISGVQKLAAFSGGAEFLDIYERFVDEDGNYSAFGPDLNGQRVKIRKDDGIHFSSAGSDKLAFYLSQSIKLFYRGGGGVGIEVADALAGTDAQMMVRPPYQGLGQTRLLEIAGAVISLTHAPKRSNDLVLAVGVSDNVPFDLLDMVQAPLGRADAFGVGIDPAKMAEDTGVP